MKTVIILLCTGLFLVGCATPYQQTGFTGGFSETQLDENVWTVSFRGNAYTGRERASDFTLLRSAEIALENGFPFFVIVNAQQYSQQSTYTTPTTSRTTASAYGFGNQAYGTATTTTSGGQTYQMSKPRSSNTIVCFLDRPEIDGMVYNARFIMDSLSEKHGIRRDR